jgi:maltose/moltooligosaccharide transporter
MRSSSGALPAERMGVYMGVFNFFIVLPEIFQALTFGWIIRHVFGEGNPNSPLYMVFVGGCSLLLAALLVTRVKDVADHAVPESLIIEADAHEPLSVPESAQPVPSPGLVDEK